MVSVSVIIPVYNQERYLGAAIDSVLAQTYRDFEVIVVDDGSTDGTPEIIASYLPRIRGFRKPNAGGASALNLGIREAQGDWIGWLSSDDLWEPTRLARQMEALRERPTAGFVFSDFVKIDPDGGVIGEVRAACPSGKRGLQLALVRRCFVNGCTTLIRREAFARVGLFDERDRFAPDYDMWFRILRHYEALHVPEPLVRYRIHPGQASANPAAIQQASRRVVSRALREMGAIPGALGAALYLREQLLLLPWRIEPPPRGAGLPLLAAMRDLFEFLLLLVSPPARSLGRLEAIDPIRQG